MRVSLFRALKREKLSIPRFLPAVRPKNVRDAARRGAVRWVMMHSSLYQAVLAARACCLYQTVLAARRDVKRCYRGRDTSGTVYS